MFLSFGDIENRITREIPTQQEMSDQTRHRLRLPTTTIMSRAGTVTPSNTNSRTIITDASGYGQMTSLARQMLPPQLPRLPSASLNRSAPIARTTLDNSRLQELLKGKTANAGLSTRGSSDDMVTVTWSVYNGNSKEGRVRSMRQGYNSSKFFSGNSPAFLMRFFKYTDMTLQKLLKRF